MSSEESNILVKGDVSGIQDFIFNVKSKHAAQELKGRSFFIKLLIEVTIQYLLDHFKVQDRNSIISSKISVSGGNFFLDLPFNINAHEILRQAQKDFTKSLQYTGINISIAYTEQTEDYHADIFRLNSNCRKEKLRFFNDDIHYFKPFEKNKVTFEKYNKNKETLWTVLTILLKLNKSFAIKKLSKTVEALEFTPYGVELAGYEVKFLKDESGIQLENYLESLFPLSKSETIKEFEDISESDKIDKYKCRIVEINGGKQGLKKLGILAMDVDGLGNKLDSVKNINEHSRYDHNLTYFFNSHLREIINDEKICYNTLCRNKTSISIPKYKNKVYPVTTGGDDSFFVGKWNTLLDFAILVNKEFNKYFPDLTISAGLVIVDPKFPVVRFAKLVENALRKAKYRFKGKKGNICLFGEVIRWDMMKKIYDLRELLQDQNLTSGLLAKARISANNIIDFNSLGLKDYWEMGYYLRDVKDKNKIIRIIENNIVQSVESSDELDQQTYRKILPIAARLAELDSR